MRTNGIAALMVALAMLCAQTAMPGSAAAQEPATPRQAIEEIIGGDADGSGAATPETVGDPQVSQSEPDAIQTPVDGVPPLLDEQRYDAAEARLSAAQSEIGRVRRAIDDNRSDDVALTNLRLEMEDLAQDMIALGVELSPRLGDIRTRLDQLGTAPEDGSREPAIVEEERERLTEERARINALIAAAEEISVAANQLAARIAEVRRDLFAETLLRRTPITADLLSASGGILISEFREYFNLFGSWARFTLDYKLGAVIQVVFFSLLAALVLLVGSYRLFGDLVRRDPLAEDPSYMSRLSVAFWSTVIPTAAAAAFAVSIVALMRATDLMRPEIDPLIVFALAVIVATYFVARLTYAILTPGQPRWRLVMVSDNGARTLWYYAVAITVVSSIDYYLSGVSSVLGSDVAVTVVKTFVAVAIIGALLIALSFVHPMRIDEERFGAVKDEADRFRRRAWSPYIRLPLRLAGIGLIALAAVGYIGMARFIASQIIVTGAILATMYIGFLCGRAVSATDDFGSTYIGRLLSDRLRFGSVALDQAGLVSGLAIHALVIVLGIPLILLQWGFQPQDISSWVRRIFTEIRFGNVSISLVGIGAGVLVFLLGYFVTRWFQRWIDGSVLARGRMDTGVRNSIRTAVGYAGVAIAALIGVSAAGLDLSNLALVAGALSLGIGFGLQNIVNNFVSGLILLAERPFKVGDWVVTGTTEGFVKRISVRATEIETFQRQSIIVPNSELINASVGNWTHRNQLGRLEVPVGVSYDADPRRVMNLMLEIARDNQFVMRNPEPYVIFKNFGDSALEFELRVFLGDVLMGLDAGTELRLAIFERFREEGISIPFPQRDLHLRMANSPSRLPEGSLERENRDLMGRVDADGQSGGPGGSGESGLGDLPGSGEGEAR